MATKKIGGCSCGILQGPETCGSLSFPPQNIFYNVSFIVLELADFLGLAMEPIFKVLPILGLLYVLVPYYNQFKEGPDFDDEDAEFGNGQ